MASSMPIPSNRSVASSTTKLCSSKAIMSMSSFTCGQRLDREANASLIWKEDGVAGQLVMGALDQLVMAMFWEVIATGMVPPTNISVSAPPEGITWAVKELGVIM